MSNSGQKRRIVLGITGGIAAYKSAELTRLLIRDGYDVLPVMTRWGARFLGPLTMESLTGHQVRIDTPAAGEDTGIEHISLIRSAELLVIAPLTANTLAKMVHGAADNFLTTTYLAHRGPTLVCPAMNTGMLEHPATQRNLAQLAADGVTLCYGDAGELACGEQGAGRMAEPVVIADYIEQILTPDIAALKHKTVLVTAGPTREDLDPVRYLTNRSSGKMGIAVARAFRNAGAKVILVHGPVNEPIPPRLEAVPVVSAEEMSKAVLDRSPQCDVVVMAAAVADYTPEKQDQKLKKDTFDGNLRLHRTTDILAALGKQKPAVLAGFAAESQHLLDNARSKLERKNLDFIFANDISGAMGFGSSDNRLIALDRQGNRHDLGTNRKEELAKQIVAMIAAKL